MNMAIAFIERSTAAWEPWAQVDGICRELSSFASEKGKPMKKIVMAMVAVAALTAATASPALAWRGGWSWGPGIAAGIVGGAIVGGAIANSPYYYGPGYGYYGPGYYPPGPYYGSPAYVGGPVGPCSWQRQRFWDGYAWRVRSVRVCG
jgi:hypothetical protein